MNSDIKVGPVLASDGLAVTLRGERTGSACFVQAHGNFSEPANRGVIFEASTAVAGVAPGTALGTTPPMALWNPLTSGVNLNVLRTSMGYVSGTLGAGSLLYAQVTIQTTAPTTGAELVPVCTRLGFPRGQGRAFQGSTLVATPTILRPAFSMGAFLATTAMPPFQVCEYLDGYYSVAPGTVFVMQGLTAAGTTPLVILGVAWEEIPV